MPPESFERKRVCILVKAYPQSSTKYEEVVCCAGITDDGRFVRLYPVPFRRLRPDQQFTRFDIIDCQVSRPSNDHRPESYRVDPDSIAIVHDGRNLDPLRKVRLWLPHVSPTLTALKVENGESKRSLGIIRPEPAEVTFHALPVQSATEEDQTLTNNIYQQASLFDPEPLPELRKPEWLFEYRFRSGEKKHKLKVHDWEIQATYHSYRERYGEAALDRMLHVYGKQFPIPGGHPKFPHLWPGQIPPADSDGTVCVYAL